MSSSKSWFAVRVIPRESALSADLFDGLCSELIELGAAGTAVDKAPEITCFVAGDQSDVDSFIHGVESLGCSIISQSSVKEENWTGACPDVWEPIKAGRFEIVPVESLVDPRPANPGAIKIIPGLGFGTGHHTTTRMVLSELSEFLKRNRTSPHSILDLGTGSGILAIAAAIAVRVPVVAIDIDPGAIDNAIDNATLNNVRDLLHLSTTPLQEVAGPFNLILANLYGEVLTNLASEVTRVAAPRATAILSGITELVWDTVRETYTSSFGWRVISEASDGGWMCAVLER